MLTLYLVFFFVTSKWLTRIIRYWVIITTACGIINSIAPIFTLRLIFLFDYPFAKQCRIINNLLMHNCRKNCRANGLNWQRKCAACCPRNWKCQRMNSPCPSMPHPRNPLMISGELVATIFIPSLLSSFLVLHLTP